MQGGMFMKKTFGIFAHVDAGKTTFSEQLLYDMGMVRKAGRVDNRDTVMDTHEIEKQRGITIFSGQAHFDYKGDCYYFLDTPGHTDFAAEAERAASVLDYAILLVSAPAGVQAHTITLFRMLERYQIPVFLFVNKCDMPDVDMAQVVGEIHRRLTPHAYLYEGQTKDSLAELAADLDDVFAERYLEDDWDEEELQATLTGLIGERKLFWILNGSALKNQGIREFFDVFHRYTQTNYGEKKQEPFSAKIYKIQYDDNRTRFSCMKVLSGHVAVKDMFSFVQADGETSEEKINEIRFCLGEKQQSAASAEAGDLILTAGLKTPRAGSWLGVNRVEQPSYFVPALQSAIHVDVSVHTSTLLAVLRQLEEEDPQLHVVYEAETEQILLSVMGKIQLEVLENVLRNRFGIEAMFDRPSILYKESIAEAVMGYGHFEPLRHYAEVHLRLEPLPEGSGVQFASECHVDRLALNWQRLIETHVREKVHRGILTGAALTDVRIVLVDGRAHVKHTEGGDFREATYRAIRQGLEKAKNRLLEPYYGFEITAESGYLGRILSDVQRMAGEFEPPQMNEGYVCVRGTVPVEEFLDYPTQLAALTKGMGNVVCWAIGYRDCHNAQQVIEEIGYDKDNDLHNVSCSVFCSHGSSFVVRWDEAETFMHCLRG